MLGVYCHRILEEPKEELPMWFEVRRLNLKVNSVLWSNPPWLLYTTCCRCLSEVNTPIREFIEQAMRVPARAELLGMDTFITVFPETSFYAQALVQVIEQKSSAQLALPL